MKPSSRVTAEAIELQDFVNALREVLGLGPLYGRVEGPMVYAHESTMHYSSRAQPAQIRIAGVYPTRPNEPYEPIRDASHMGNVIDKQITRDRHYARTRVNLTERQADDDAAE